MAPLQVQIIQGFRFRKVLLLHVALLFVFSSSCAAFISANTETKPWSYELLSTRKFLERVEEDEEDQPIIKKKKITTTATTSSVSTKNQTKLIKLSTSSSKNQTKSMKTKDQSYKPAKLSLDSESDSDSDSRKNKTKLIKSSKYSIETSPLTTKKLNSTSKSSNSTKTSSLLTKKSSTSSLLTKKTSDLTKLSTPKNKTTTKESPPKQTKTQLDKNLSEVKSKTLDNKTKKPTSEKTKKPTLPTWVDQEDEDDLVAGFRALPTKFQENLLPDLEKISQSSKSLYTRANKQITKNFKPYVGTKYAPAVASIVSFAFILIPLVLVSLIFNRIKAYFSLQKLLIFIQVYLSIYFSILCLSSLVTGLEPLKFFYATSQSTYVGLQVLQTLAYVLYLLLLLMYLVLVFSTETGLVSKFLGLLQTIVGFSVGLHYYMTVFHRAVLHQPPRTNWRVHAIYATCFLVICLLARADRRKKAYLEEGGGEGKRS